MVTGVRTRVAKRFRQLMTSVLEPGFSASLGVMTSCPGPAGAGMMERVVTTHDGMKWQNEWNWGPRSASQKVLALLSDDALI